MNKKSLPVLGMLVLGAALVGAAPVAAQIRRFECPPTLVDSPTADEKAQQCQLLPEHERASNCETPAGTEPARTKLTHVEIVDFDGLNLFSTKARVIYCGYEFVEKGYQTDAHCRFETSWKYEQIARKAIRTGVVATVYFCQIDHEVSRVCQVVCNHRPR